MGSLVIKGGSVFLDGSFRTADILCENGVIAAIGELTAPDGTPVLNAQGMRVVPGFIDIHSHGAVNVDVNAADADGLRRIAAFFASQGVTAFHASILTDTISATERCLQAVQTVMQDQGTGAQLLGAHLQGPFLSPQFKGAMPEHLLRKGDAALIRRWMTEYPGVIRYITVSPQVEGVTDVIRQFQDDVVFAIGHSGADYAQAMAAIRSGARVATHTFNAMRPLHHHEPAIIGAALESDCWCEAICDGLHLHPGTVRLLLKCKGYDRVVAVTDSIMASGLPDGQYKLGVNDIVVRDGDARLASADVRAGSTLTMNRALKNLLHFTAQPLEKILPLLTANPAAALRIDDRKGRIAVDYDADLVLLDDELNVRVTCAGGQAVWNHTAPPEENGTAISLR